MRALICAGRLAVVIAACLALPSAATAATTISSGGTQINYNADPGQTNTLTISRVGANYVYTDSPAVTITAMAPCVSAGSSATCPAANVNDIRAELDDLNDSATIDESVTGNVSAILIGQAGDDVLTGGKNIETQLTGDDFVGTGADVLTGGDLQDRFGDAGGNDVATGGGGDDIFFTGDGNDRFDAGAGEDIFIGAQGPDGADTFIGGPDGDRMDFRSRTAAIIVSFNDVADDGAGCPGPGCEGDDFRGDIEELTSGAGADTLIGNAGRNDLRGDDGDDTISGGGGNDQIGGDQGDDVVSGDDGNDRVSGGGGTDTADGGAGDDYLFENFSDEADVYAGGTGLDELGGGGGGEARLPLSIDLDGVADDGLVDPETSAAKDNVLADIEGFNGGDGDDVLIGSDAANQIEGGGGDDKISGAGGADELSGADGADAIDGGASVDSIFGGGGIDALRSRDGGPDQIDCGSSLDTLLADPDDDPEASCEGTSTGLVIGTAKLAKNGKSVKLGLSCPAVEGIDCAASAKLLKGKKTFASGTGTIAAGATGQLKLKVKGKGKGKGKGKDSGKQKGKLSLSAIASFADASGQLVTTTAKVRVG